MFRQGQLAVLWLAILLGRNEAGISNRGKIILHHAVHYPGSWIAIALPRLNLSSWIAIATAFTLPRQLDRHCAAST